MILRPKSRKSVTVSATRAVTIDTQSSVVSAIYRIVTSGITSAVLALVECSSSTTIPSLRKFQGIWVQSQLSQLIGFGSGPVCSGPVWERKAFPENF